MSAIERYRQVLQNLSDWEPYLLQESRLPGPRANLELAQAVALEGDPDLFRRFIQLDTSQAPPNTPAEFLPFCGLLGYGRLLADGNIDILPDIRHAANDQRWRMREGAAMALQQWDDRDMERLLQEMAAWAEGSLLEQRAAAATLCEPRLIGEPQHARRVLEILDRITTGILRCTDRKSEPFKTLRKGLGYCWSVAVAAEPNAGKRYMEKWLPHPDPDIRWIMKENLKKERLSRMDRDWVQFWKSKIG
jgi:hypothetical protein